MKRLTKRFAESLVVVFAVLGAALLIGAMVSGGYGTGQGPNFNFHDAWGMFWAATAAAAAAFAIAVNLN